MKERIIELIPKEESKFRDQIKKSDSNSEIMTAFFDFVGPDGKNIWQDKKSWPDWLLEVEKIYVAG